MVDNEFLLGLHPPIQYLKGILQQHYFFDKIIIGVFWPEKRAITLINH